jgi:hypothetical protein
MPSLEYATRCWQAATSVAAAGRRSGQPQPLLAAVHEALDDLVGAKLFTVLKTLQDGSTERIYTSDPVAYPVSGRKPRNVTSWYEAVILARRHFLGPTKDHIRAVFFDHETIFGLGCGSVINVLVIHDDRVLGAINMLHEEHWYRPDHLETAEPFAQYLVPVLA